jgi:hypothetical protein
MALPAVTETPPEIAEAIRKASKKTGTDFNYLLKTAERESSFAPKAKARTSSAAGLFQFIESTWLQMVKTVGHRFGLGHMADEIVERRDGSFHVADAGTKNKVLQLRYDPEVSALMAGEFTRQNADYVRNRIGRDPTSGELYIAHFLGARQGTKLIELAQSQPNGRADIHFSRAARANRSIFYRNGSPRTLDEVYQRLTNQHDGPGAVMPHVAGTAQPPSRSSKVQRVPPLSPQALGEAPLPVQTKAKPLPIARVAALDAQLDTGAVEQSGIGGVGVWGPIVKRGAPAAPAEVQSLPFEVEAPAPDPASNRKRAVRVEPPQERAGMESNARTAPTGVPFFSGWPWNVIGRN